LPPLPPSEPEVRVSPHPAQAAAKPRRCANEADAVQAVDFLRKKRVVKRSWGYTAGKRTVNYTQDEEHKIKPHKLRNLRDHECVLVHCERGFRRVTLPPLEPDGNIAKWFSKWRRVF